MAKERGSKKQTPRAKASQPSQAPLLEVASVHTKPVTALAFSPDGRTLVSGSDDATVRLWDAATGEACNAGVMGGAPWGITEVVFSPDGCFVAAVSQGVNQPVAGRTRAFLWDLIKRKSVELKADNFTMLRGPAFASDGRLALVGGGVRLFDAAGGLTRELPQGAKGDHIAFSPDGAEVVFGDWEGPLHVLDVAKQEETSTLEGHTDYVTALAFSPVGHCLASSTSSHGKEWEPRRQDRTVRVWDFKGRKQLACWSGGWETTTSLAFLANGRHLLSFHDPHGEAAVHLWSADAEKPLATWSPKGGATAVAVRSTLADDRSINGLLATGHGDGTIKVWDLADVLPTTGIARAQSATPPPSPSPASQQAPTPPTKSTPSTSPAGDEFDEFFSS